VADRELGEVRGELFEMSLIIERDGQFSEEGERGADGAFGSDVVPTKKAVGGELGLELEVDKRGDSCPEWRGWGLRVEKGVVTGDHDALTSDLVLQINDRQVIVRVVIIGPWLAGQTHAGKRPELSFDAGLDREVQVDQVLWDVEALHLLHLEEDCLAMLRLIERGVIIRQVDGRCQVGLAPLGELERSVAGVNVEVVGAVEVIEVPLIFLDWAESQDYGVVHEGESLAGFPWAEQRALVDLVLRLREDADHGVAPIRIGTERVGHDDCLRFGGELSELVQIDALSE
jgi:hypothetical protein